MNQKQISYEVNECAQMAIELAWQLKNLNIDNRERRQLMRDATAVVERLERLLKAIGPL